MHGVQPMPHPAMQSAFDGLYPAGDQWYWRADFVQARSPTRPSSVHARFGAAAADAKSTMHLYPVDGAAHDSAAPTRRGATATRPGPRSTPASTPIPPTPSAIRDWTVEYFEALHPYSAGGAYVNMMMDEGPDRVRASYRDNYDRLARVKAAYDPDNVFRSTQNIPPARSGAPGGLTRGPRPHGRRRRARRRPPSPPPTTITRNHEEASPCTITFPPRRARPTPACVGRGARPARRGAGAGERGRHAAAPAVPITISRPGPEPGPHRRHRRPRRHRLHWTATTACRPARATTSSASATATTRSTAAPATTGSSATTCRTAPTASPAATASTPSSTSGASSRRRSASTTGPTTARATRTTTSTPTWRTSRAAAARTRSAATLRRTCCAAATPAT